MSCMQHLVAVVWLWHIFGMYNYVWQVAEWTKEVSGVWRELSTKERKVFDDKAVIDKERYAKAVIV